MSPRRALSLLLLSCLLTSQGCKTLLWDDLQKNPPPKTQTELDREKEVFLGIVVDPQDQPEKGVKVKRVLRFSPADRARIRNRDVILVLAGNPIDNIEDLKRVLSEQWKDARAEILVLRKALEKKVEARLTTWRAYNAERERRTTSAARASAQWIPAWPIVDYRYAKVNAGEWLAFYGVEVTGPIVMYRDLDFFPLVGIFSIYRTEATHIRNATRNSIFAPFGVTSMDDKDSDKYMLKPGQERLREY